MRCFKGSLCFPCFVLISLIVSLVPLNALAQTGPCLNVWPDTISFHRDICADPDYWQGLDTQMVAIYNDCDGDLQWSITPSDPWVISEPSSGGNFDSVMVFLDPQFQPEPMPAPGDSMLISAYLTVEAPGAENSPSYVAVNFWITCVDTTTSPDSMIVVPSFFNFTASPNQTFEDSIHVYDLNGETVMFELTNRESWLMLPVPFTPWTTPATIPFGVQTTGLAAGTYADTILVTPVGDSSRPSISVPVLLNVVDGSEYNLVAAPSMFNLTVSQGGSITGLGTLISEQSGASLNFWVETRPGNGWIDIRYPDVEYPGWVTPDSVIFDVLAQDLAPGLYADTIVIFNPLDDSSWYDEILIPVVLSVTSAGSGLATDPSSFDFTLDAGDSVRGESLYIYDLGGGAVDFWTYNYSSWLYVDTMAASPLITPETITIDVSTDGLAAGTYADTVFVMSYELPAVAVPVFLTVTDSSSSYEVQAIPSYFSLTLAPGETLIDSLYIYEVSGANVPFHFIWFDSWLTVDPFFPLPPYATPANLQILVDATDLAPGFYADTIQVFPDTGAIDYTFPPIGIPVYLQVESASPQFATSPMYFELSLNTGDVLEDVGLLVYEPGGGSLPFAAKTTPGSDWLQLHDSAYATHYTPDSIYFDVMVGGLPSGTYVDSILIYSPYADSAKSYVNDVYVPVILTVQGGGEEYTVETSPDEFVFNLAPGEIAHDSLHVFEIDGFNIPFAFSGTKTWLVVEPFGMPPYITPTTLSVHIVTDSLPIGRYTDSIYIYNGWGPPYFPTVTTPVILNVGEFNPAACGDADGSGGIDIDDVVYLVNYIFSNGDTPQSVASGDIDCNGSTDIDDVVFLIQYIFMGGPEPCSPCMTSIKYGM